MTGPTQRDLKSHYPGLSSQITPMDREAPSKVRTLIDYASCGGCAGKIPVEAMAQVLDDLPRFGDPNLLVGAEHFSDAGVYRLRDDLAIVNTVDFFPPMVDDPYIYGQIAAANALSDVYATGAEPRTALNIVCFPDDGADSQWLTQILRGSAERVQNAGAVIVGGHSLRDNEIKFGLALTGVVDPRRMLTNAGAQPGDALVLTKPLGTGFAVSAYRARACPDETLDGAVASMIALNRPARDAALACTAHGATDVTGFGLAGHAAELGEASEVTIFLQIDRLPKIAGAETLAQQGHHSRATKTNRSFIEPRMSIECDADDASLSFLFDAQTSGGLLISVAHRSADDLVARCHDEGLSAARVIGEVAPRRKDAALVVQ